VQPCAGSGVAAGGPRREFELENDGGWTSLLLPLLTLGLMLLKARLLLCASNLKLSEWKPRPLTGHINVAELLEGASFFASSAAWCRMQAGQVLVPTFAEDAHSPAKTSQAQRAAVMAGLGKKPGGPQKGTSDLKSFAAPYSFEMRDRALLRRCVNSSHSPPGVCRSPYHLLPRRPKSRSAMRWTEHHHLRARPSAPGPNPGPDAPA
jgi:hypothetical protein